MPNTIDRYIISFSLVNNPYPCYLYMFVLKIIFQSSRLCPFGLLPRNPLAENGISKKISGYVTGAIHYTLKQYDSMLLSL